MLNLINFRRLKCTLFSLNCTQWSHSIVALNKKYISLYSSSWWKNVHIVEIQSLLRIVSKKNDVSRINKHFLSYFYDHILCGNKILSILKQVYSHMSIFKSVNLILLPQNIEPNLLSSTTFSGQNLLCFMFQECK